jgi:valyl-tRNA synthetase
MTLAKRYDPAAAEPRLQAWWQQAGIYNFDPEAEDPAYSIDTPPPTVSGNLHMGHVYSYSHPDIMARFWRMNGRNVFYPMGYDDNGLPTERLVERRLGVSALRVGRKTFIERCLELSEELEQDYQALWQRLGLSVDWRYLYRTIDDQSRHISQRSFVDLQRKGLAYHQDAPAIWCPECRTAIAQAELNDLTRESEFVTLPFERADGSPLLIATTRPELLPACVAVFVHPTDERFRDLVGQHVRVPLFGQQVPVLADLAAEPEKGTGAVMCCTFGDTTDVDWWRNHGLPLRMMIERDGTLAGAAGPLGGLPVPDARRKVVEMLQQGGMILGRQTVTQSVRVHERCDTPVEYIVTRQWFIRVLDFQQALLDAGEQITWHPPHMKTRYREWVENLRWDWGISRQRAFGVPLPVWYCVECGAVVVADETQLPVDPTHEQPAVACACGSMAFEPDQDVMDTWATSSLSPQIAARWLAEPALYERLFPMSLRAQAHEIIRTWAFYAIVKEGSSHLRLGSGA